MRTDMERIIRVTGKGKISVKPDTIRLELRLTEVLADYGAAVKESASRTEFLREIVEKAGLDPQDLRTTNFGITTEYESYHDENGVWKQRFLGYRYDHSLYVAFPAENSPLGRLLSLLSVSGLPAEFRIAYTVKDPEPARNELIAKAVSDSKKKAAVLAEAAGVSLGRITSIDYSWGHIEIMSRPMNDVMLAKGAAYEEACDAFDINADDIDLEDTVTVVWELV